MYTVRTTNTDVATKEYTMKSKLISMHAPESLVQRFNRRRIESVWRTCDSAEDMMWLVKNTDYTVDTDVLRCLAACLQEIIPQADTLHKRDMQISHRYVLDWIAGRMRVNKFKGRQGVLTNESDALFYKADQVNIYKSGLYSQAHAVSAAASVMKTCLDIKYWTEAITDCICALEYAGKKQQVLCDRIRTILPQTHIRFNYQVYDPARDQYYRDRRAAARM